MTGGHGHIESGGDKRIALLIAVLALILALVETGGKSSQTDAITRNVEATNLWAFYQARTIRQTTLRTASETAELGKAAQTPAGQAATAAQQKAWSDMIARWDDDPKGGEGRKQLAEKARISEQTRERSLAKYHAYEYAAALLQVAIVVTSASIVTGVPMLALVGLLMGIAGTALGGIGFAAPELLHFGGAHH